jgi:hypothetical protein
VTWSVNASGHHQTNDWRKEEHDLLRRLADAVEADETNRTSSFSFYGNHVQATSLLDARQKLEAYDAADPKPA